MVVKRCLNVHLHLRYVSANMPATETNKHINKDGYSLKLKTTKLMQTTQFKVLNSNNNTFHYRHSAEGNMSSAYTLKLYLNLSTPIPLRYLKCEM
jgi:hypothetical protein